MMEKELYPQTRDWLLNFLNQRYKKAEIFVEDTHKILLSDFLERSGIPEKFPEFKAYDIKVDITGIIITNKKAHLVFVECKIKPIRLLDVGQLLGYSLVSKPLYAYLFSPEGISDPLNRLLKIYGRYDILRYGKELTLKIAQWDIKRKEPLWSTVLPSGEHLGSL